MSAIVALCSLILTSGQDAHDERPIKPIVVRTVDGKAVTVPDPKKKATVLVFLYTDCPIANRYAPEFQRIQADYEKKDVFFVRVYVFKDASLDSIRSHTRDYAYKWPAVHDKVHTLVKALGAKVTPEAVVLSSDGRIAYKGRIDDMYVDHGRLREGEYRRDLRIALDEVLADKPVTLARTTALGCFIGG